MTYEPFLATSGGRKVIFAFCQSFLEGGGVIGRCGGRAELKKRIV